MFKNTHKVWQSDILKTSLLAIIAVFFTFQDNGYNFSTGGDDSLVWAFNYLFANNVELGRSIIFPHGPLAFLTYPIFETLPFFIGILVVLKTSIVFNFANLLQTEKSELKWLVLFITVYFLFIATHILHLFYANLLLLFCNFHFSKRNFYKYGAIAVCALALYVKSSISIISILIFTPFLIHQALIEKKLKASLIDLALYTVLIVLIWLAMYKSLSGFATFLRGVFELAQDNSSAASLYPYNNWIVISIFLLLLISLFVVNYSKASIFLFFISFLSLFAIWKHGMAREDGIHAKNLFMHLYVFFAVALLFYPKNRFANLLIASCCILLFSLNLKNTINHSPITIALFKGNHIVDLMKDYKKLRSDNNNIINQNIEVNTLPQNILDTIENQKVDVYPWEYTIAAANGLNWQPRVVLDSYAAYTSWLDKRDADHFNSLNAPEFIIWELQDTSLDENKSRFGGIDNRYLLNDEPQTIISLLENYQFCMREDKFLVVKKRKVKSSLTRKTVAPINQTWNRWIPLPTYEYGITRVRWVLKNTFLQSAKSFFYKDEEFKIGIKLQDNSVRHYKIVPKNAADGLWLNPYIYDDSTAFVVKEILFQVSNEKIVSQNFNLIFEHYQSKNDSNRAKDFFGIDK